MGWGSGSVLFSAIISSAKKHIPNDQERKDFYREVYDAFGNEDWDTEYECFQDDPLLEEVYRERWGED